MGRAAGVMVAVFTLGSGALALLGPVLGSWAEAATLILMGTGLYASSALLGTGRPASTARVAREA